MKPRAFPKQRAGRWVQPKRIGYLMACCDCGLVHRMDFRIVADQGGQRQRVQFRTWRHKEQTKALRKRDGIIVRAALSHPSLPDVGKQ